MRRVASDEMGQAFVARQAIFDQEQNVIAYELLYRGSATAQTAVFEDTDKACRQTIISALCDIGLEELVGRHQAFLNLSEGVLLSGELSVLPASKVVIEVLEDVVSTPRIRAVLEAQKRLGFTIALDDFELDGPTADLAELADIIKVDVLGKNDEEVASIVARLRSQTSARLLAEKVETHAEYEFYRGLGFEYFQGFFLCRPQLVSKGRVPRYKASVLELLGALEDESISLASMEDMVQRDATLSYKLLKLLNSSMMGLRCQVDSIGHATVLIGQRRLKRWATLIALAGFDDCPDELLGLALIRARMCELLAEHRGEKNTDSHFTVGLLSALDAMSGLSMEQLVEQMPLAEDVRVALVAGQGHLGSRLRGVMGYERGNWEQSSATDLSDGELAESYIDAVQWADQMRSAL
ncbi:MAG: HDOD domain-containing protein [Myxococcales bacterium]|nr:HDOD domain-containing protein [Myxococcales bacterium]